MMREPYVKFIEVPCAQQEAFDVFVNEMDSWWPLGKFTQSAMRGLPAKGIRVDARPGGEIVEIGGDDAEVTWGSIIAYEPYGYVSMNFHVPHPSETSVARSLVEVRFIVLEQERTRVELTQSNWEAFGDRADMMFGGYRHAWVLILEQAYKSALER
jgi:hypothetical protein